MRDIKLYIVLIVIFVNRLTEGKGARTLTSYLTTAAVLATGTLYTCSIVALFIKMHPMTLNDLVDLSQNGP